MVQYFRVVLGTYTKKNFPHPTKNVKLFKNQKKSMTNVLNMPKKL